MRNHLIIGNKAKNLIILNKQGFNIPKFFVLNSEIISEILSPIVKFNDLFEIFFVLEEKKALIKLQALR